MSDPRPKVSVLTTTYNHERYIEQAVRSVATQQTNFPFEMIVGEDCSTDQTRAILLRLQQEFPGILRLRLRDPNWGRRRNFIDLFHACQGDYIAILEGDDFWTSPHKSQRQADFLDSHPDYAIVFHPVHQLREDTGETQLFTPPVVKERYTLADLVQGNFIGTCSVMFRNRLFTDFPVWFQIVSAGDYPLHILNAEHGDIGYLPEPMATYRLHAGGVWSSQPKAEQLQATIQYTTIIRDYLAPRYADELETKLGLFHLRIVLAHLRARQVGAALRQAMRLLFAPPVSHAALWRAWRLHHQQTNLS
jgi:glycosyltransferase involved in cell wall biosynthesis